MEQIHIERLERLYALAIEIHADQQRRSQFDLGAWMYFEGHASRVLSTKDDGCVTLKEGACGTTACMVGWAGMDPVFNAEGFCLKNNGAVVWPFYHATGEANWRAVDDFFGLNEDQSSDLFNAQMYPVEDRENPLAVAARIAALLEEVRA